MLAEIFGMDGIIVVVVLAVVLFGGSQIPKLARSLGSARREFSQGLREGTDKPATVLELPVLVTEPLTTTASAQGSRHSELGS